MGVLYQWKDDVILDVFIEQPWTWKEYLEKMNTMMPTLREKQTPCATVVHVNNMGAFPKDGNVIHILMQVEKAMPPNVFASAIAGRSGMVTAFMNVLMKIRPNAKRIAMFCKDADEAYEKIYARHKELQENKMENK